jgi:hypothetical protein
VSVQDRCTVYAKRTIGIEIILDAPDGTLRRRGSVGAHFVCLGILLILMQYRCTICVECSKGSESVLDAPDGTPW